jgi:hypothetical protein
MITKEAAIQKATIHIVELSKKSNCNLLLLLDETIDFEYGWVFFYQTKEYIETGDIMEMAGGNAPLIIDKRNGNLEVTGTGEPIEYYIEKYIEKMQRDKK